MPSERPSRFKWSIISVTLLALAAFGKPARAQEATEPAAPNAAYVDDWTHHHLVFSNPGARDDAVKNGRLEKWQGITNDPRYQLQQAKRTFGTRPVVADPDLGFGPGSSWDRNPVPRGGRPPINLFGNGVKKDWSTPLGSGTTASSLTATIATPLTSSNISGSSTLTIDGVTFDASAPTAATQTGTFTGNPTGNGLAGSQYVTVGADTFYASDSTPATQTGTFSSAPLYNSAAITVGGLSISTSATQSSVVGTFTAPFLSATTATVTSANISGSTTTSFISAGTGTAAIGSEPASGDQITVGAVTYIWESSCTGVADCIVRSFTTSTNATNLARAINGTCGGNACAANTAAAAIASGTTVYVVNLSTSATPALSTTSTHITIAGTVSGTIPVASATACSGTTGTFAPSNGATTSTTILATNFAAAINACPAADGLIATSATNTVTVKNTTPGATTTFAFSAAATNQGGLFAWAGVTSGSNGAAASCTATTGRYPTAGTLAGLATNLKTMFVACPVATAQINPTAADIALNGSGGITVQAEVWGTAANTIAVAPTSGYFAWQAATLGGSPGTAGTNGTTSATSFAVDNVNSDNAAALALAITDAGSTVTASHTTGSASLTVTAVAPGTGGNSITLAGAATGFAWAGSGTLANGSDGTTSGTSTPPMFAYWSGATYLSSAQLATNIATAVNANTTVSAELTATANSPSTDDILFAPIAAGTGGDASVTPNAFSAFSGGGTLSGGTTATVQPNAYPAKWGPSLTTASCANDFVVYPTGQPGSSTAANIIAYNNLYTTGCTNAPSAYWAFDTGDGYAVTTSPILAWLDGSKVAFIQSNGATADLVVVKWAAGGTLGSPATNLSTSSNITTCPAPCMTVTNLSHNDTYSSPYYDYINDALYVGDDNGYLEKFTGVFNGTAVTAVTPVLLNTTTAYPLASPIYDEASGCVFVGDTEGYLYSVRSGVAGTVCTGTSFASFGRSAALGGGAKEGIFDGPLVDPVAEKVYVFVADSGDVTTSKTAYLTLTGALYSNFTVVSGGPLTQADVGDAVNIVGIGVATIATVAANGLSGTLSAPQLGCIIAGYFGFAVCTDLPFQLTTTLTAGDNYVDEFLTGTITSGSTTATPVESERLGTGGAGYNIYSGAFDNVYFSSANGTGNLYALGNTGVTTGATLYRIPITAGLIGNVSSSAVTGLTPSAANAHPWPSPATEFYDNGTDYLFFSVNRGNKGGCTSTAGNGCILSYNITTTTPAISGSGLNVTTPGTNGCWATGGLVIDNSDSGTAGAQQIYFVNLNGATAGGVDGTTPASSNCASGAGPTIQAVQAAQSNP